MSAQHDNDCEAYEKHCGCESRAMLKAQLAAAEAEIDALKNCELANTLAEWDMECKRSAELEAEVTRLSALVSVHPVYIATVVNNNQPKHDVILRPDRNNVTIPVGTKMISCPHPDLSHDCCVWCGMSMIAGLFPPPPAAQDEPSDNKCSVCNGEKLLSGFQNGRTSTRICHGCDGTGQNVPPPGETV